MRCKLLFITVFISLLFYTKENLAQTPNLGTTSNFALFTAVGAFDNTGVTTSVTGDVGTNAGAFNAFPPGILVGQKYIENTTSAQAATDVEIAYTDLLNRTCEITLTTPLGNGQTLTPGVYCLTTASTLNGNLTLDGQGNPDALFIIKINGAFALSASANILLTNSASLCNVYWQVGGQFDLGTNAIFRGTLIANGAINLLEGSALYGRGLSKAGAISLTTNQVEKPSSCATLSIASFDDKDINEMFVVYPNPCNTFINIATKDLSQIYKAEFRLYDVMGREVLNSMIQQPSTNLEILHLPSGIYFYKLVMNNIEGASVNNKIIQSGKLISY